jgi:hypothetical protein
MGRVSKQIAFIVIATCAVGLAMALIVNGLMALAGQ